LSDQKPVNGSSQSTRLSASDSDQMNSRDKPAEEKMLTNTLEQAVETKVAVIPEMSAQLEKDLVQVFKLLSDETRLRILFYLSRAGEMHVTALCDRLGQSQPAVSHHLALLRVAGLIEARRDGKHNFYSVRAGHFHQLMVDVVETFGEGGEIQFEDFVLVRGE